MTSVHSLFEIPIEEERQAWRSRSLQDRLIHVFENNLMVDVEIIVRNQIFKAHKCILAPFSSVFKKVFYNEKEAPPIYIIKDIVPDGFHILLRVLYHSAFLSYGEANTENFYTSLPDFRKAGNVIYAYDAAEKLEMPKIKALLEQLYQTVYLHRHSLSLEEFWIFLKFSQPLKFPSLKILRKYANRHAEEILKSKEFFFSTKKTIKILIHLLDLPECMIFEGIAEWFERNNHLPGTKKTTEDLIACLNFQKLSVHEFRDIISRHEDLMNIEGIHDILKHLVDPALNILPTRYSTEGRNFNSDPELTVEHVKQTSTCLRYFHEGDFSDVLIFAYHCKKYIRAHKLILYLGSAAFEYLLHSSPESFICMYTATDDLKMILKYFYGYPEENNFKSWMSALKAFERNMKCGK